MQFVEVLVGSDSAPTLVPTHQIVKIWKRSDLRAGVLFYGSVPGTYRTSEITLEGVAPFHDYDSLKAALLNG
ncbi:MAG: hypothetical protein ACM3UO_00355 [Bacillota bacterium]